MRLMELVSVNKACPNCGGWEVHVSHDLRKDYVLRRCDDCGHRWEDRGE